MEYQVLEFRLPELGNTRNSFICARGARHGYQPSRVVAGICQQDVPRVQRETKPGSASTRGWSLFLNCVYYELTTLLQRKGLRGGWSVLPPVRGQIPQGSIWKILFRADKVNAVILWTTTDSFVDSSRQMFSRPDFLSFSKWFQNLLIHYPMDWHSSGQVPLPQTILTYLVRFWLTFCGTSPNPVGGRRLFYTLVSNSKCWKAFFVFLQRKELKTWL